MHTHLATALLGLLTLTAAQAPNPGATPTNHTACAGSTPIPDPGFRATVFGERPSWHPNGTKIAFMSKSFGDAYEYDMLSGQSRLLTHYRHRGYLRAQYLPNGDLLLGGAADDEPNVVTARNDVQELWILKQGTRTPIRLGQRIFEGVAISRTRMKIAWSNYHWNYRDTFAVNESRIYTADISYNATGYPTLVNKTEVTRTMRPDCMAEIQDFYNDDRDLTFSCYVIEKEEIPEAFVSKGSLRSVNIETKKVSYMRNATDDATFNEWEGAWPTEPYAFVESNRDQRPNENGDVGIDIWRLRLEPGSEDFVRLTVLGESGLKGST